MATTQTLVRTISDIFYEDPEPVEAPHAARRTAYSDRALHCPLIAPAFPRSLWRQTIRGRRGNLRAAPAPELTPAACGYCAALQHVVE